MRDTKLQYVNQLIKRTFYRHQMEEAMREELFMIEKNKTWEHVDKLQYKKRIV